MTQYSVDASTMGQFLETGKGVETPKDEKPRVFRYQNIIGDKLYKTAILFSNPEAALPFKAPELNKYVGYLKTNSKEGLVRLEV